MARHCVKWSSRRRPRYWKKGASKCTYGRVKGGPRKGRCRKRRVVRRRARYTGKPTRYRSLVGR